MALKAMADNSVPISVRQDASVYDALANKTDYVLSGIDNELNVTYGSQTFKVTLGTGGCVICGRHVFNDSQGEVGLTLAPNDTGYLVLRYDLTQSAGKEASFITASALETGDLNSNGTKKDLPLGKYVTGDNGVTSYIDMRPFTIGIGGIWDMVDITIPSSSFELMGSPTYADYPYAAKYLNSNIREVDFVKAYPTIESESLGLCKMIDSGNGYFQVYTKEVPSTDVEFFHVEIRANRMRE